MEYFVNSNLTLNYETDGFPSQYILRKLRISYPNPNLTFGIHNPAIESNLDYRQITVNSKITEIGFINTEISSFVDSFSLSKKYERLCKDLEPIYRTS